MPTSSLYFQIENTCESNYLKRATRVEEAKKSFKLFSCFKTFIISDSRIANLMRKRNKHLFLCYCFSPFGHLFAPAEADIFCYLPTCLLTCRFPFVNISFEGQTNQVGEQEQKLNQGTTYYQSVCVTQKPEMRGLPVWKFFIFSSETFENIF